MIAAPPTLVLVPVGTEPMPLLSWLGPELARRLHTRAVPGDPLPLSPEWLDAERGQFCSNRIVDALVDRFLPADDEPATRWALGVTKADLFADGRRFVFGEAAVGGCCAVISVARLAREEGRPVTETVLRERILKEALHELGHVAGLDHCVSDPVCVMVPSEDPSAVDEKSPEFCFRCGSTLPKLSPKT